MLQSINPYLNSLIQSFPLDNEADLIRKVEHSELGFKNWKQLSFAQRGEHFLRLAQLFSEQKNDLAKLITAEMGKPIAEAIAEIEKCIAGIKYYAEKAEYFLQPTSIQTDATESYLQYEPLGTVLALMPWNFPFWQSIRCAAPAMMAGNTILLKLAPNTTGCAIKLEKIFHEAGFPNGSFQSVMIENETTSFLIQQKGIKAISLTGSERAGVVVATEAGRNLKKVVLELGGSDPFIVFPDVDIDGVAEMAIKGRLQNTGQSCIAAKRFILHQDIADLFIFQLIEKIKSIKIGDPIDVSTQLGPMARRDLKRGLIHQVKKSLQQGASLVYGELIEDETNLFSPVILKNIKPGMPAYAEELFGPVFSVFTFSTEEEAIQLANDTSFGLGASIWMNDTTKAKQLASQIESGMVFINDFVRSDIRLPFGGIKTSGYGRELSELGIKEFVNVKTVYVK